MVRDRDGFTLIEVMVAVMIVSVVIAALWQMRGDSATKLFTLQKMTQTTQYSSFFLGNSKKYGFEKSHTNLYNLVDEFDLDRPLRRKLKNIQADITYDILQSIDTNESLILEIGKTVLETQHINLHLLRVRLQ